MSFFRNLCYDLRLGLAAIRFRRTVSDLLDPKVGCPWDLEQTHASLRTYIVEEAFEAAEEMLGEHQIDSARLREELGDVLFQVFLNSELAMRNQRFSIASVFEFLNAKIIRRHPHVFDPARRGKKITLEEIFREWKSIKAKEKRSLNPTPHLDSAEKLYRLNFLHALHDATVIGEVSRELNFDWTKADAVLAKVEEELNEVKEALAIPMFDSKRRSKIHEEMGDLLFSIVQLCRHLEIPAEECLTAANKKFVKRFTSLLTKIKEAGQDPLKMTAEQLEQVWTQIKTLEV